MNIAQYIDHTLLRQDATNADVIVLCNEAISHSFASVCVNPCRVPIASKTLADSAVKVCTVTAFPLGATSTVAKLAETKWCLDNGADEIDTVINIGECKAGNWDYVEDELRKVAELVHSYKAILKVIFENCLLDESEIVQACKVSMKAAVDFVKTSTGFSTGGATQEDVKLMVETVAGTCRVKAAGGIRNYDDAVTMINLGADRIGTSGGVAIVAGEERVLGDY